MKYLVTAFQEFGGDSVSIETCRFVRCRLATAREICKEVFARLADNDECTMVCVALWRDGQRVFLIRQGE